HRGRVLHRVPAAREPPAPAARIRKDGAAVAAGGVDLGIDRRRARGSAGCPRGDSGGRGAAGLLPGLATPSPRRSGSNTLGTFRTPSAMRLGGVETTTRGFAGAFQPKNDNRGRLPRGPGRSRTF